MTMLVFMILYIVFVITVVTISFFMVTRLDAYSLDPEFTKPLIVIYIIITVILVIINIALFTTIPLGDLLHGAPSTLYRY